MLSCVYPLSLTLRFIVEFYDWLESQAWFARVTSLDSYVRCTGAPLSHASFDVCAFPLCTQISTSASYCCKVFVHIVEGTWEASPCGAGVGFCLSLCRRASSGRTESEAVGEFNEPGAAIETRQKYAPLRSQEESQLTQV